MPIRALLLIAMTTLASVAYAGPAHFEARSIQMDGRRYPYQIYVPENWNPAITWPVVLFLHGSGERGDDNQAQLSQGLPPWLSEHAGFPAVVVMPQAPNDTHWDGAVEAAALRALETSVQEFHGDRRRLYLTGLSMGGYGAWRIAVDHPGLFAAAAVVCGGVLPPTDEAGLYLHGVPAGTDPYAWVATRIGQLPVWIFHGALDDIVPPAGSRALAAALQARGGEVRYSEYPGVNHGSWPRAYAEPQLWPWLFGHRLAGP